MAEAPSRARQVGARITRKEDPRMVRGRARYIDDITPRGALHMRLVRAPLAHAEITGVDASDLERAHPDALVFSGDHIGGLGVRAVQDYPEAQPSYQPLLARGKVRFVGEPVAAVLTGDPYSAEDAAELLFIDYEPLDVLADVEKATAAGAPMLHDGWTSNLFVERQMKGGDLAAARENAAHVIRRTYRNQRQAGVPMECRGVIAGLDAAGDMLTVRSSTQIPHLLRTCLAEELDWPENRIRVVAPEVGGGFGVKGHVFVEELLVAWLAIRLRRPVKWIEDRREHLMASIHAREHTHVLEAYVAADGRLLGLKADITVDVGAYSVWPFTASSDPGMVAKVLPGPYDIAAYEATFRAVGTNKCPIGTYRGVGRPSAVFSLERLMDEIAIELAMDPIDLRLHNMVRDFPYRNVLGITYDEGSYAESLERMRDLLAPDKARAKANTDPDMRIGVGVACYLEQSAHGTADFTRRRVPIETGYESARVEMSPDGRATVFTGLQCHGQGHETTFAQVAADQLGIGVGDVAVRHGDTLTSPYSVGTWGSRGAALGGGAVHKAAASIREKLLAIAAQHLQVPAGELTLADGMARRADGSGDGIPVSRLARWANRNLENLPEGMAPGLVADAFLDGPPDGTYSNACHGAVVEIDTRTGRLTLRRFVVVEDCGTMINPMIVDGQVRGGVAQGIGSAMLEHFVYDEEGQPLTTTFADYLMPGATDIPDIELHHIETPTPLTPLGAKGMGEGGAIGPPAAIAAAVADALGVPVRETPLSLNRVWELCRLRS
jgi:carbon-monoxide dehydrogenase large subunit